MKSISRVVLAAMIVTTMLGNSEAAQKHAAKTKKVDAASVPAKQATTAPAQPGDAGGAQHQAPPAAAPLAPGSVSQRTAPPMVHSETVDGVLLGFRIADLKKVADKPGAVTEENKKMAKPYRLMVRFMDPETKVALEKAEASMKVVSPDGKEKTKPMQSKIRHLAADFDLPVNGTYMVTCEYKLAGGKSHTVTFPLVLPDEMRQH